MAMSSGETHEDVVMLLTRFNFEIEALPDDLRCGLCKSVLKNACRGPCGCRFCFNCISKEMADGVEFCGGGSKKCGKTPLSRHLPADNANKSIARLIAKCPQANCSHKCPLADMEGHLWTCHQIGVDCSSVKLDFEQDRFAAGDMEYNGGGIIAVHSVSRKMEIQSKCVHKDKGGLYIHKGNKNKSMRKDIILIKDEIKSIKDEHIEIKDKLESIEQKKEVLTDRVRQLSEQLEREIERRCESEENGSASLESGEDWDALEEPVQLGRQIDISCDEWLIDADIGKTEWGWGCLIAPKTGASFTAEAPSYTFQLASWNRPGQAALWIWLRIVASRCDSLLEWPFRGTITVTVADRDRHKVCSRQTRQCRIKMPLKKQFMSSDKFVFWHSELREAGLDLQRGVRVWCQVVSSDVAYPDNDDVMDITPIVNHHLLP